MRKTNINLKLHYVRLERIKAQGNVLKLRLDINVENWEDNENFRED